jgi:hypothetical protein
MRNDDPVKMKREVHKIEGDRNLYNYTFEIEDDEPEAEAGKLNAQVSEQAE